MLEAIIVMVVVLFPVIFFTLEIIASRSVLRHPHEEELPFRAKGERSYPSRGKTLKAYTPFKEDEPSVEPTPEPTPVPSPAKPKLSSNLQEEMEASFSRTSKKSNPKATPKPTRGGGVLYVVNR